MIKKIENARERVGRAAMDLFRTRGYDETTVAQIAAAAGLTQRTFFRYFADKAEVLFWRAPELEAEITDALRRSQLSMPIERVLHALETSSKFFEENRENVIARHHVIAAHTAFQERELAKMGSLARAIASVLEEQDVKPTTAHLVAETAVMVWRRAIYQWCDGSSATGLGAHLLACLKALRSEMGEVTETRTLDHLVAS